VFQSPNEPLIFNGIMAGEDIVKQLEALKRRQKAQS
jgi:hypothetical protein